MTFFGLKQDQDLENWAAHPHQEFPGVPPGPFSFHTYAGEFPPPNKGAPDFQGISLLL